MSPALAAGPPAATHTSKGNPIPLKGVSIYVAASFLRRNVAGYVADALARTGAKITSRWITCEEGGFGDDAERQCFYAQMDLEDVASADVIVCVTGDNLTRGGRHTEVGMALITGCNVFLFDPREQVFHFHPLVSQTENLGELARQLIAWKAERDAEEQAA